MNKDKIHQDIFIKNLSEQIDDSKVKITFGLQNEHIEIIEAELKEWSKPMDDGYICDGKYIKSVWEKLGKKIGWCPFTLSLYYFEYLEKN
jgi:hypothetical protein